MNKLKYIRVIDLECSHGFGHHIHSASFCKRNFQLSPVASVALCFWEAGQVSSLQLDSSKAVVVFK